MVDENVRRVTNLSGLPLAIYVVSVVCLVLSAVSVALRVRHKLAVQLFGFDDSLIVAGLQVVYAVDVALACHGATVGLGSWDVQLNEWLSAEGKKYLMLWMLVYIVALATIKASICATLHRIASSNQRYRISVFVLFGLNIASMLVTFIGVLLLCSPVSGLWTGKGECAPQRSMVALSYTSTAATIVTDLALAVLPGIMVWNTAMKPRRRIAIFVLLSFGSIASVTTMIRAPYIEHYWTPLDNLNYWTGYIVLLSNVESAVGCITSSVPSIRASMKTNKDEKKKLSDSPTSLGRATPDRKSLVTFGSLPARNQSSKMKFRNPTDQGVSIASVHAGNWTRLQDGGNSRDGAAGYDTEPIFEGIRAEYSYAVELSRLASK